MSRLTAKDFSPELLEIYDYYVHGKINKREFLSLAGKFAVGGLTAATLLTSLSPNYALAEQVEFTDPDILPEYIHYPSPNGNKTVRGYLVRPAKASGKLPAVVVVHENRGLNPYIEDVARRLAKAGFIALAPDGLSVLGGYPGNDEKGREMQAQIDPTEINERFLCRHRIYDAGPAHHRKGRHHRFLLWRWRGQCRCGGLSRTGRGGAVLRSSAGCQRRSAHQGPVADPLRRIGYAHQRRLAGL